MKWIEIIRLRSSGKVPEPLEGFLWGLKKEASPGLTRARIYRHANWQTDWALHLHCDSEEPEKNGSALGLHVAQALKEFGLVDHSIWIEED
ncbi:MAG: hypothetical protein R6X07_14060 [Desulfatiglandales bacterium]